MERPEKWTASEWRILQPLREQEAAAAYLQNLVNLAPTPGCSVDEAISNVILAPRSWQRSCYTESFATTVGSATLTTALADLGFVAAAGLDFEFVNHACQGLTNKLGGLVSEDFNMCWQRCSEALDLLRLWNIIFTSEQAITDFVREQIRNLMVHFLPPILFGTGRRDFRIDGCGGLGNGQPGISLGFSLGAAEPIRLMAGAVKTEHVASLPVMRWMLWILGREPGSLFTVTEPFGSDKETWWIEKKTAWLILRQIWLQQVINRVFFNFLTNGDDFVFFTAGSENRHEILGSRIYLNDGSVDGYDGTVQPDLWNGPALDSPPLRPFRILMALCCSADALVANDNPSLWIGPGSPPSLPASRLTAQSTDMSGHDSIIVSIDDKTYNRGRHRLWYPLLRVPFVPIELDSNVVQPIGQPFSPVAPSDTHPIGFQAAHLQRYVRSGAFADGYMGFLRTHDQEVSCFFKIVRSCTFEQAKQRLCSPEEALPRLIVEAQVLDELKDVGVTPYFFGACEANDLEGGKLGFIAMEQCGLSAQDGLEERDKHVIIQLLDRLHAAGYGHGDLELRHIVRKLDEQQTSVDHQWLFIDLEHSFKITAANTEAAVSEKAILRQLLQVDDIPSS